MEKLEPASREKFAQRYMALITMVGFTAMAVTVPNIDHPFSLSILIMLGLFLIIMEFFSIPILKGSTTLGFPIVFTIDFMFGLSLTLFIYGFAVLIVNLITRRPIRVALFNPAQLMLSFLAAKGILFLIISVFESDSVTLLERIIYVSLFTIMFYIVNNIFIDIVLWLRPQSFTFTEWKQKASVEIIGLFLSVSYLALFFFLMGTDRGVVDIFSFFFFFSPLVALSLIGASNFKLRREKNRLKGLISIKEDLNPRVAEEECLQGIERKLTKLFDYDALSIWVKEGPDWTCHLSLDSTSTNIKASELEEIVTKTAGVLLTVSHLSKAESTFSKGFLKNIAAAIFCPLNVDEEVKGLLLIGRARTQRTQHDESEMIKAFATQVEVLIKGRNMISERERRMILEERNRIAREIHDGIAQSVAGAVMMLEVAKRKSQHDPQEALTILGMVVPELRASLKEIRESIFALRPYPTEEHGLHQAIEEEVNRLNTHHENRQIEFTKQGPHQTLSPDIEKMIYNTFRESVQNALKYAQPTKLIIMLYYQKDHITLKVLDDGQGFRLKDALLKAERGKHFGILSMNKEAKRLNAKLEINSVIGKGTSVLLVSSIN